MSGRFLGVGLFNAVGLALFAVVIIVMLKAVTAKHPVPGVSTIIQAV